MFLVLVETSNSYTNFQTNILNHRRSKYKTPSPTLHKVGKNNYKSKTSEAHIYFVPNFHLKQ